MTIEVQSQGDRLLTSREVGAWVGLTPAALSQLRFKGRGPKFRRLGPRTVRYVQSDVQAWIDEAERTPSAETL
jgi:predicted DNA-binding transcriptional regulator AlpA